MKSDLARMSIEARRIGLSALLVCAGVALASCDSLGTGTSDVASQEFADRAEAILDEARAAGASDAQMAILEAVADTGVITESDYTGAVNASLQCFAEAGIDYQTSEIDVAGDIRLSYAYAASDATDPIASTCVSTNSSYVERLYALRPEASEKADRAFKAALPAIIACLNELDLDIDPEATVDEVKLFFQYYDSTAGETWSESPYRCLDENGITAF